MMMFISMSAKGSSSEGRRRIHIGRHSAYHDHPIAPYGFNSLQTHQHYK